MLKLPAKVYSIHIAILTSFLTVVGLRSAPYISVHIVILHIATLHYKHVPLLLRSSCWKSFIEPTTIFPVYTCCRRRIVLCPLQPRIRLYAKNSIFLTHHKHFVDQSLNRLTFLLVSSNSVKAGLSSL